MAKIKIVTDAVVNSTACPDDIVSIIDLPITINGQVFSHISKISKTKYLQLLNQSSTPPQIGSVAVTELETLYNNLGSDGSQILSLHISDSFADTCHTARQAAARSNSAVTVINSGVPAAGLTYQLSEAVRLIRQNADLTTIVTRLQNILQRTRVYISINNNSQLMIKRKISRFRGAWEKRANIKYLMRFANNNFEFIERTTDDNVISSFWRQQVEQMHQQDIVSLDIIYTGSDHRAQKIYRLMNQEFPLVPITLQLANPEMMNYIGKDATGVTYLVG
ncbi:DegV family EDD domain-containing protein [Lentilactobacillus senioris]|uniref:DegV family protein n=1 Tax=Lentilactobacillus senioris TaxID=931534 RepID=UPI002280262A|nr:DegV family protein [Lentilactobacillus senioris]MCY9806413.1 DegV family EDD domain-containing protein [Lentilactobacillus senioris]